MRIKNNSEKTYAWEQMCRIKAEIKAHREQVDRLQSMASHQITDHDAYKMMSSMVDSLHAKMQSYLDYQIIYTRALKTELKESS